LAGGRDPSDSSFQNKVRAGVRKPVRAKPLEEDPSGTDRRLRGEARGENLLP